jgi:hypothetical protein
MKVLILWNTAGAFTPIAKYLNSNGHEARIVMREDFDIYGHTKESECAVMVDSAKGFYIEGIKQILYKFRPDIIHCSSYMKMVIVARAIAPRTPIILSYHGSDIRFAPRPHAITDLADFVHVTTPDLQQYGTWIDRVVDDYFYYRGGRKLNTALMYYSPHYYIDTRKAALKWCSERGITLTIIDRTDPDFKPIPNKDMPNIYSAHEYYLDWKGQKDEIDALSRSALEALACRCNVVHDSDKEKIITPEDYRLAREDDYVELYDSLLKVSRWQAVKRYPRVLKGLVDWARGRAEHYGG